MRKTKVILPIVFLTLLFALVGCGSKTTTIKPISTTASPSRTTITTATNSDGTTITKGNTQVPTGDAVIYLHYFRYDNQYEEWNVWSWNAGKEGTVYQFVADSGDYSYGGVVAELPASASKVGFIIKTGEGNTWDKRDIGTDRFINTTGSLMHVYVLEGTEEFGIGLENAPKKVDKIATAFWADEKTITYTVTSQEYNESDIKVIAISKSGSEYLFPHTSVDKYETFGGQIHFSRRIDYSYSYKVLCKFGDGPEIATPIGLNGVYDTAGWADEYNYDGDDLGVTFDGKKAVFKLWAPASSEVTLLLYTQGNKVEDGVEGYSGVDTPYFTQSLERGEHGVWQTTINPAPEGLYYTYKVTTNNQTREIVDPYAKSCGVNGYRGQIVNFDTLNSKIEGWSEISRPNTSLSYNDNIIYEVHVRDFTISDTWTGSSARKGTFLAMAETGTTYNGKKTGLDHLVEMGITTVQILPFYDQDTQVDETKVNDTEFDSRESDLYNWGYNPLNYNCLEGSYSTNPWDGKTRIMEFKTLMLSMANAGLRVNMDVVFNHMGKAESSPFEAILPGYYFRLNSDGTFSNGSGCGNELASERYMVRKFIVDSTEFWASEYNISGFRFDLMALEDVDTMNAVANNLHENVDPSIMVYGEPWTGGGTTLSYLKQSTKTNTNLMALSGVGAFNDSMRDAIKGSNDEGSTGWIQGNAEKLYDLKIGLTGRFYDLAGNPNQSISYVACHDNKVLIDKISETVSNDSEKLAMAKQAYALVLLSQGIPFIHAGDEFLRTKGGDHNSYDSGDLVNGIDWSYLSNSFNSSMYSYIKDLIAFRKTTTSLGLNSNSDVASKMNIIETDSNIIAYTVIANGRTYLFIHTNSGTSYNLPSGEWTYDLNGSGSASGSISGTISIGKNETVVLHK